MRSFFAFLALLPSFLAFSEGPSNQPARREFFSASSRGPAGCPISLFWCSASPEQKERPRDVVPHCYSPGGSIGVVCRLKKSRRIFPDPGRCGKRELCFDSRRVERRSASGHRWGQGLPSSLAFGKTVSAWGHRRRVAAAGGGSFGAWRGMFGSEPGWWQPPFVAA